MKLVARANCVLVALVALATCLCHVSAARTVPDALATLLGAEYRPLESKASVMQHSNKKMQRDRDLEDSFGLPVTLQEVQTMMLEAHASATVQSSAVRRGFEPDPYENRNFCHKNHYRKRTMKVIKEVPFIGLFYEMQGQRRFEASGIVEAKGNFWVVFDNLEALGKIDLHFNFRGPENTLVGPVDNDSQFEGIAYMPSTDTFLAIRESFEHDEHGLVPVTLEIAIDKDNKYEILRQCPIKFVLQDVNKGFESLYYWEEPAPKEEWQTAAAAAEGQGHAAPPVPLAKYMLGLCESNFCKTTSGDDAPGLQRGNGRLVMSRFVPAAQAGDECSWKVEKVIVLPPAVFFLDYAAISFLGHKGSTVAVASQEDSAVWVGEFDWEALEFKADNLGRMYHFPRDEDCAKIYCNVEGLAWLDSSRLVFTSDRSKITQDHRCMTKDQSVHVMALQ